MLIYLYSTWTLARQANAGVKIEHCLLFIVYGLVVLYTHILHHCIEFKFGVCVTSTKDTHHNKINAFSHSKAHALRTHRQEWLLTTMCVYILYRESGRKLMRLKLKEERWTNERDKEQMYCIVALASITWNYFERGNSMQSQKMEKQWTLSNGHHYIYTIEHQRHSSFGPNDTSNMRYLPYWKTCQKCFLVYSRCIDIYRHFHSQKRLFSFVEYIAEQ